MKNYTDQLISVLGNSVVMNQFLARYTTMKIGGIADFFYEAGSTEEIVKSVTLARKLNIPITVLGGGTNTLIGDHGIRGLVVKNNSRNIQIRDMKGGKNSALSDRKIYVEADSGVIMNSLIRFTIEEQLRGLEMQLGLPGTVGGAVFMNSKWTHPENYVGDSVFQATILTTKGDIKIVPRSYFAFAYDTSSIQKTGDIVLNVVFTLKPEKKDTLWSVASDSMEYRRKSQPQGVASLGCTFRNITKAEAIELKTPEFTTSAGFLVDRAGLKGKQIGNAQISPIHANFILNRGHATASDVIELIELARHDVKKKFGVILQEEIVRKGDF